MDERKIEECETLEELFKLWENAHEIEDEESCNNTICDAKKDKKGNVLYIPKNSFIDDGYINKDKTTFNGILFVLKEANVLEWGGSIKTKHGFVKKNRKPQHDFYRKYISDNLNLNIPKQQEKMGRMAYYIRYKKMPQENDEFKKELLTSAFMNLNKRGGWKKSEKNENYVDKYKNFIIKEIDIIKPKIIICLGTYKYLDKIGITKDYKCYDIWHPAYQMSNIKRNRRFNLNDANVDLYMEEFIKRVNL